MAVTGCGSSPANTPGCRISSRRVSTRRPILSNGGYQGWDEAQAGLYGRPWRERSKLSWTAFRRVQTAPPPSARSARREWMRIRRSPREGSTEAGAPLCFRNYEGEGGKKYLGLPAARRATQGLDRYSGTPGTSPPSTEVRARLRSRYPSTRFQAHDVPGLAHLQRTPAGTRIDRISLTLRARVKGSALGAVAIPVTCCDAQPQPLHS